MRFIVEGSFSRGYKYENSQFVTLKMIFPIIDLTLTSSSSSNVSSSRSSNSSVIVCDPELQEPASASNLSFIEAYDVIEKSLFKKTKKELMYFLAELDVVGRGNKRDAICSDVVASAIGCGGVAFNDIERIIAIDVGAVNLAYTVMDNSLWIQEWVRVDVTPIDEAKPLNELSLKLSQLIESLLEKFGRSGTVFAVEHTSI